MTPRVLMVVGAYYPELAGGSLQCRTLVAALRGRASCSVLATTGDRALPRESEIDGVPVHRVFVDAQRPATKAAAALRVLSLAPRLVSSADIFHFHGFTEKMLLLAAIARLSGRRTIEKMTSVGWDDPLAIRSRRFGRWLAAGIRGADRIVAVSPAMRERCRHVGLKDAKIRTIPNGVDTARFVPAPAAVRAASRARLGLPSGLPIVAFIGFWSAEKGPDVLFRAWLAAREAAGADSALLYVGSTDEAHAEVDRSRVRHVRARIGQLGLADRVIFVERTSDVASYLQASDLFAMPSSREGLSNALLEAMACGLPCIAAAIPGVTDSVIEDGASGFIVPPGDERALASVLTMLLRDRGMMEEVGRRARQTILERYAIDAVADRYLALYGELLGGRRG
ncbi:MAG: glycosyltransferase family 4 protein [Acidobacteria bacterium]|nr:glycosyltransferase family 4 protein [Acidobacteriota bacterium]